MDFATRKYNFIKELATIDEKLLDKLENFLSENKKDWFSDFSSL
jgi:hypothetical protein